MDREDQSLVKGCLAGDQDACARLVARFARLVGTVIWRATGDRAAVEDLTQETFLRVFRGLPYFTARAKLSTWIYTIAHRVSVDHLRRSGREPERSADVRLEPLPSSPSVDPLSVAAREEIGRLVHDGLAQLPEKYRLPLVYASIDGLDYETIAAMLEIPEGTVKTLVFRGKRMLKDWIVVAVAARTGAAHAE